MKHAVCEHCGAVLHVPWWESSSDLMAHLMWTARLAAGCRDCGGPLRQVNLQACSDCAAVLLDVA
jgi:hypothetical protein